MTEVRHATLADVADVELVSYAAAALRIHRSPGRVRAWASEGRLTVYEMGRSVLVDMAEVWSTSKAARRQPHGRGRHRPPTESRRVVVGTKTRAVASSHSARSDCPPPGQL